MTGGTPADLHNILSVQAKNALIFHIFWDWTERQNREMDENDPETRLYPQGTQKQIRSLSLF